MTSAACMKCHRLVADNIITNRRQNITPILFEALLIWRSNWECVTDFDIVNVIIINQFTRKGDHIKKTKKLIGEQEEDLLQDERNTYHVVPAQS